MGSTFVYKDPTKSDITGLFNKTKPIPVWLQFVPGIVKNVITTIDSAGYVSSRDINSIVAKSHINEDVNYSGVVNKQYFPLFRGMVDVPVIGDQVLLCTFGGVNYYIGPVNTANNPNWNIDHLNVSDARIISTEAKQTKITNRDALGLSKNFGLLPMARLQKIYNNDLDHPDGETGGRAINDIHGDFMFEGRHGNSIRIGSRNVNPYIMISNGRGINNILESTTDGSILAMLENGTIRQHFPRDSKIEDDEVIDAPFVLASDSIEEPKRLIGEDLYGYDYTNNQIFQSSEKITINAKKNGIFVSSFKDTIIGSGKDIRLFANWELNLDGDTVVLGTSDVENEPVVRGDKLTDVLKELVGILESAHALIQGVPVPITDSTATPLLPKIQSLKNKLSNPLYLSDVVFIESNNR